MLAVLALAVGVALLVVFCLVVWWPAALLVCALTALLVGALFVDFDRLAKVGRPRP